MKLLIHTTNGQTTEVDLADVLAIGIEEDSGPWFELRMNADRPSIQVSVLRPGAGMLVRPTSGNSVGLRPGDL